MKTESVFNVDSINNLNTTSEEYNNNETDTNIKSIKLIPKRTFIFEQSKKLNKRPILYNYLDSKTNSTVSSLSNPGLVIQPFPLLHILTNKHVLNNSSSLLNSLLEDHSISKMHYLNMKFKLNTNRSLFENKSFHHFNKDKFIKLIKKKSVSPLKTESPDSKAKLRYAGGMHTMNDIKGKNNLKKIILNNFSDKFSEASGLFLTGEKNYISSCHKISYINTASNTCDTQIENEMTNINFPSPLNFGKKIILKNPKLRKVLEGINKTENVNESEYIKIIGNEFLANKLKNHSDKIQIKDNNKDNLSKTKSSFRFNTIYKNVSNKALIISKNKRFNEV